MGAEYEGKTAKELGSDAAMQNKKITDNPFPEDTISHELWKQEFLYETENVWECPLNYYFAEQDFGDIRNLGYYTMKAMSELGKTDINGNFNMASERELCRQLGVSSTTVNNWFNKGATPNDDAIISLARLAKEPPHKALIERDIWNSKGVAREIYISIWNKLFSKAKKAALMLFCLSTITGTASAAPLTNGEKCKEITASLYIMEINALYLRRALINYI